MLVPSLVLILLGIKNKQNLNEHLFALQLCIFWLVYIFGEESGWRGYLQQIIKTNDYGKALIVGIQWYIWHLSFLLEKTDLTRELVFFLVLIVGSFVAIKVTKRTNCLLTSVGLHFSFSVMTNIPAPPFYLHGILLMLIIWAVLLWKWPKNNCTACKRLNKTQHTLFVSIQAD